MTAQYRRKWFNHDRSFKPFMRLYRIIHIHNKIYTTVQNYLYEVNIMATHRLVYKNSNKTMH